MASLIERMAQENHRWGYQRIQGKLFKLAPRVGASTIHRVLQRLGIPPIPVRDTDTTWQQFLHTPASTMLTCDFFPMDYFWNPTGRASPSFRASSILGVVSAGDGWC